MKKRKKGLRKNLLPFFKYEMENNKKHKEVNDQFWLRHIEWKRKEVWNYWFDNNTVRFIWKNTNKYKCY